MESRYTTPDSSRSAEGSEDTLDVEALQEVLRLAPDTRALMGAFRTIGLSDADMARAARVSIAAVRSWRDSERAPRDEARDRLDALRLVTLYLLGVGALPQPEGTARWLRMRRFNEEQAVVVALDQIAAGAEAAVIPEADAFFGLQAAKP